MNKKQKHAIKVSVFFIVVPILIFVLAILALRIGSVNYSTAEIFNGLFDANSSVHTIIIDLRLPRVILAIIIGMCLAAPQRNGFHAHRAVVVDNLSFSRIERVEDDLVAHALTEKFQLGSQQPLQVGMTMDVQVGRPFQHTESRNQTDESEAVVTVEVRNENMVQPTELQS